MEIRQESEIKNAILEQVGQIMAFPLFSMCTVYSNAIYLHIHTGIHILAISPPPPPGGGESFFVKNREEFEGGLEKRKGKGGKRRKKYIYEA